MAKEKQTTEQETINFLKNQPFLEEFLIWHNVRKSWVIAYKDLESGDAYLLKVYLPSKEPYTLKEIAVGKTPGAYYETLSHPQKLPKEPV